MRPLLVCLPLLWLAGCSSPPAPAPPVVLPPKITQFYASPSVVPNGESTLLCYGVESATSVTLDPGSEALTPALVRCIEKTPTGNTTYTLTAKGKDGRTVTQTAAITTGIQRLKFLDLSINAQRVKPGETINFCFQAQGAAAVTGGPGRFQKGGNPARDCLIDQPRKTTTYKLTIRGPGGQTDSDSMTVQVQP